jgi:hypothetical protein
MYPSLTVVADILGYIGIPLAAIRFVFNDRKTILLLNALLCVVMSAHYGLLGGHTAALIYASVVVSSIISALAHHLLPMTVRVGLAVATISLVAVLTPPHGWLDVLPIIGFAVARVGEIFPGDLPVRLGLLGRSAFWIVYAAVRADAPAAALEAMNLITNGLGLVRRLRHQRTPTILDHSDTVDADVEAVEAALEDVEVREAA